MASRPIWACLTATASRPGYQAAGLNACAALLAGLPALWALFLQEPACCTSAQHVSDYGHVAVSLFSILVAILLTKAAFDFLSYERTDGFPRPLAPTAGRVGGGLVLLVELVDVVPLGYSVVLLLVGLAVSLTGAARVRR